MDFFLTLGLWLPPPFILGVPLSFWAYFGVNYTGPAVTRP